MLTQRLVPATLFLAVAMSAPGALIYLSDKGPGQGATPGNLNLSVDLDQTFTLYLWATLASNDNIDPLAIDVLPSNPNVLGANSAVVQNPSWLDAEEAENHRWRLTGVAPNAATGDVDRFAGLAFTVPSGWDPPPAPPVGLRRILQDPTYEAGAGFLLGSISYTAKLARTVSLSLRVGDFTMGSSQPVYFGTGDAAVDQHTPRATSTIAEAIISVAGGPGPFPLADGNHDNVVNALDVSPFITAVTGGGAGQLDTADVNRDGAVNALDIANFVTLVTGGTVPGPQPQLNLVADVNADGFANCQDAVAFFPAYISAITSGSYDPSIDVNVDGVIDASDLSMFWQVMDSVMLGNPAPTYDAGGAAMAIPEPSATVLLSLAALVLRRRSSRQT